jgi:hypothetical protein
MTALIVLSAAFVGLAISLSWFVVLLKRAACDIFVEALDGAAREMR